jgi:hypothetical protein
MWLSVDLKTDTKKRYVSARDWTTRVTYAHHSKLKSQHNWGGTYTTTQTNMTIFTLRMKRTFIRAPETMKQTTMGMINHRLALIVCFISYEKGAERKLPQITSVGLLTWPPACSPHDSLTLAFPS